MKRASQIEASRADYLAEEPLEVFLRVVRFRRHIHSVFDRHGAHGLQPPPNFHPEVRRFRWDLVDIFANPRETIPAERSRTSSFSVTMPQTRVTIVLAAVERCRKRLWAHCYRMTGRRAEADDLSQEAIARAIERADALDDDDAVEGWLFRIATTVCLDHFRREQRTRLVTELVDPITFDDVLGPPADPEATAILRDDVRLAVVAALQHLAPKQRAVLLLHDVCGLSLAEAGSTIGTNGNAAKATLHRARATLDRARGRSDVDVPVDLEVVERLARALESRAVDELAALLADDVWGVVDGGGVVRVATRPTFGARALVRRFGNLSRRVPMPVECRVVRLNAEPAVLVTVPSAGHTVFASVHVETRDGHIVAMRVIRDPAKLVLLQEVVQ